MFKRRVEDSGKSSMFQFAFKIFFVHIINIIVMLVLGMLLQNLDYLGLEVGAVATSSIITAVCMVLYLIMIYLEGWRRGERDYNLVLYKHMEYNRFRGVEAGIVSQIPGLLCAVLILLPSTGFSVVKLARYFYINCNYLFTYIDNNGISGFGYYICYFLPALIAPIAVGLAYHLGYKRIRLIDKIVWKNPNDKKGHDLR